MEYPEYMRREMALIDRVEQDEAAGDLDLSRLMHRTQNLEFFAWAEDREHPTYIRYGLPRRFIDREPGAPFRAQARPGEYFVFQLCAYACRKALNGVRLRFGDLSGERDSIEAKAFTCFNLGGVDCHGQSFEKRVDLGIGAFQSLWIGVPIPKSARGAYCGFVEIAAQGVRPVRIALSIEVAGEILKDGGVSEPWRMARLKWLDSALAIDDEVTAPYTPIQAHEGGRFSYLGRELELSGGGLPAAIRSFFERDNHAIGDSPRDILAAPVRFIVETDEGELSLGGARARIMAQSGGRVQWESRAQGCGVSLTLQASLEYDGFNGYRIELDSERPMRIRNVRLEIPYRADAAVYWMGLGQKGGLRKGGLDWKWDPTLNQDTLWMGDVNAGLMVRLLGPEYEKPNMLFYYLQKPLNMPRGWDNGGEGSVSVREDGGAVLFCAQSGALDLTPGEPVGFYFDLYATPVKPIDAAEHWQVRYLHAVPEEGDEALARGANLINVHHANEISPYINFPFLEHEALAGFVREQHEKDRRVKLYYTVKEMTHKQTELWAFRSLGDEVVADGNGTGFFEPTHETADPRGVLYPWYRRYMGDHFIPAWTTFLTKGKYDGQPERSVVISPTGRYNNYYIEDIAWLVRHTGIDGIYLDDIAADRITLRRMRKVLDRLNPGSMIDLHSWNYFENNNIDDSRLAGWANSVNLYIDSFAYIDRMWFGEGFDYDEGPDFWLIEMSGIPFGMMGEMLQNDGNKWRGMVYGMTARLPATDVRGLWAFWDDFGILGAKMFGYWHPDCPLRTGEKRVMATVYAREGAALLAIANWDNEHDVRCRLDIDWQALGLDPARVIADVPEIDNYQGAQEIELSGEIVLPAGRGLLIRLREG